MEHLDAVHVNVEQERSLSYPLREPVTQPKTAHYCLHQNYFGIPCQSGTPSNPSMPPFSNTFMHVPGSSTGAHNMHCHHPNHYVNELSTCTCGGGNMCTRTCYPSHTEAMIHPRRTECVVGGSLCECHRNNHRQSGPPIPQHMPRYHYPASSRITPFVEQEPHTPHAATTIHLATNNLTYPSPHYAMAFASSNEVRSTSWEPVYQREFTSHLGPVFRRTSASSSIEGNARHVHHHHHHVTSMSSSRNPYSDRLLPLRNGVQQSYAIPHHVRRYTSRLLSYPYPSVINYTGHHTPQYIFSTPILIPPRHIIETGLDLFAVSEMDDGEWEENVHNAEPAEKGLKKDAIEKLPHYLVTKSTMEEFTDRERCVICISEFDVGETLRILPCAHEFHIGCVDKWLENNATCPICRTTVGVS